jgi:lysophospholipase L1-like esterase
MALTSLRDADFVKGGVNMQLTYAGNVVFAGSPDLPGRPNDPEDPFYKKRILCEGDSWFSIGAIPSSNLLYPLKFAESTVLYNIAKPGDTIINMATMVKNPELEKLLGLERFAIRWDMILLSGGGNDLIARMNKVVCSPAQGAGEHLLDYVNLSELGRLKVDIQRAYMDIAAMRDSEHSLSKGVPIVTHIYDYPTPRNAPARFLMFGIAGPWLCPAFLTQGIPESKWVSLSDYLFDWLGQTIMELQLKIDNFHVVSTRDLLVRASLGELGNSGDWKNEIHPNEDGYEKLAAAVSPELYCLLYHATA